MPPGVSQASNTGHPDAIPAASPVIPPPSIHVLAPRSVNFVIPNFEIQLPCEPTSRFRSRVPALPCPLSHPDCQSRSRNDDSACIHNGLQSTPPNPKGELCNFLRIWAKRGNIGHFFTAVAIGVTDEPKSSLGPGVVHRGKIHCFHCGWNCSPQQVLKLRLRWRPNCSLHPDYHSQR